MSKGQERSCRNCVDVKSAMILHACRHLFSADDVASKYKIAG